MGEYNGCTNHATWLVKLWLSNDYGLYHTCRDIIRHTHGKYNATQNLKEEILAMNPLEDSNGLFVDLLNSALSEVDWDSVAETFIEEENDD
jgi:hypothetical protein